ncbi:MAG: cache domain-containing protein [Rhodospirillales bacterium]|nr:cache domain-containing protein [Rhodospirillales bacterium]
MHAKSFLSGALCALFLAAPAFAEDRATAAEAEAMVKQAAAAIKTDGAEKVYSEIDDREGGFVDRDLYIVVYSLDGKCLAHGANKKLIGKDLIDIQDVDGKYYIKERMELAKTKQSFWQDYKFTNPTTKKIEPKQMYCEKLDNSVVCGGIYKS